MKSFSKIDYDKFDLKWYVLNEDNFAHKSEFSQYPYTFHNTNIRPWNVFNNWKFKEAAIDLTLHYIDGKFNLETLRADNMEVKYNLEKQAFDEPKLRDDVAALSTDFEAFVYQLMRELQWQEWSRCEYEICVAPWSGRDNDKSDKIDTYIQVLPNANIFANYVLTAVMDMI